MAATRRRSSVQIFQDPIPSSDHREVAEYEAQLLSAFAPVTDVSSDQHTLLEPPIFHAHEASPRKTDRVSSSPPPNILAEKGINNVSIPPPIMTNFRTDSPIKKAQRHSPKHARAMSKSKAPIFSAFPSAQLDKENVYSSLGASLKIQDHNTPADLPQKALNKRSLTDTAPLRDRSNKKQKVKEQDDSGPLPEPHEMPLVEDDGGKPNISYANLIGMAILRAPSRRLTLAQIYKWISDTFKYYRNQESGWQNSIRHNLSLSKDFQKQERPKDDPGKGHYWVILPGSEHKFYRVRSARRISKADGFLPSFTSDGILPTVPSMPPSSAVRSMDSSKFPDENELPSSDATIPCSDPAAHDGHEPLDSIPPPRQIPSSPPTANIHSSPPAPISRSVRDGTPPRAPRLPTTSRSGGRKRKFTTLGDSGYYSSIESSATKGQPLGPLLTSEADLDRPVIKRGRAEEEIARIRGSSYDSPTKNRTYLRPTGTAGVPSSPFHRMDPQGDGPLTPAFVFKRPALPPASASPNTNLQNHRNRIRELVGSPDKSMAVMVDNHLYQPWSPAVNFPDDQSFNLHEPGFNTEFDVFAEFVNSDSPSKAPSAKRPRLERAATTTGILADITGTKANVNSRAAALTAGWRSPFLDIPSLHSPVRMQTVSPLKAPTSNPLPGFTLSKPELSLQAGLTSPQTFDLPHDENIFVDLHSDESEETGFDILQGFQKIGASVVAPNGSPSKPSRPSYTRSSTSRF